MVGDECIVFHVDVHVAAVAVIVGGEHRPAFQAFAGPNGLSCGEGTL